MRKGAREANNTRQEICSPRNTVCTGVVNPAEQKAEILGFYVESHILEEKSELGAAEEPLAFHVVFVEYGLL